MNLRYNINSLQQSQIIIITLLLCSSLAALAIAFFMEYWLHMAPCKLCYYQRYIYMALVATSGLYICRPYSWMLYLASSHLLTLASVSLAFFHLGLEMHWWKYLSNCAVDFSMSQSFEDFKNKIDDADLIQCNIAQGKFLGFLSPTALNLIYASCIELILLYFSLKNIIASSIKKKNQVITRNNYK